MTSRWQRGDRVKGHSARDGVRRRWAMRAITILGSVVVPVCAIAQVTYTIFPVPSAGGSPMSAQPDGRRVTLTVRDSTIEYVVGALARQAHLQPAFVDSPVLQRRVTVQIADIDPMEAIASVLRGTGLVAKLAADRQTVVIRAQSGGGVSDQRRFASGIIAGRVTDSANGQGLGGASVKVAGTKLSAVTSDSGNFTLRDVPAGEQVLDVRLFGYKPTDRTVTVVDSQRTMVRIIMVSVPTVLSGVVTTATGTQRKVEVGNDITSLNVDSIMQTAPVNTVTDLLESRVPGLTVTHSSGEPGAPSRLRLRGIGSITGNNDPIIIVDGVRVYSNQSDPRNNNLAPGSTHLADYGSTDVQYQPTQSGYIYGTNFAAPSPIDQIDPNNIETIEVFKGPSAAALYGSDAASGVIVITTKHGRAGPTHWSLDLGQGVNWIPGSWPTNDFRFGTNAQNLGPFCNWYDPTCLSIDSVVAFQALNDPRYTVFRHGSDQTASLTISGGVPVLQYSITGTGSNTLGNLSLPQSEQQRYDSVYGPILHWMVRPDNYGTWGVNGSLTAVPSPTFQVTLQSSLFNSNQQTSSLQGAIGQLEGLYVSPDGFVASIVPSGLSGVYYPTVGAVISDYTERVTDAQTTTQDNLTLAWRPRVWLPITASGGLQTIERTDETSIPYGINVLGTTKCGLLSGGSTGCGADTTGYYGLGQGLSRNRTLSIGTSIPIPPLHVTVATGGQLYSQTTNDFTGYTDELAPGVSVPTTFTPSGCIGTACGNTTLASSSTATYGWYLQPQINMGSRFFANPGFRLDGGSAGTHATTTGGAAGGLSAFPKIDLSYLAVNRQSGPPLWGFLTLLRPRLALGLAGTQPAAQDRLRLFNVSDPSTSTNPGQTGQLISSNCPTLTLNGTSVPSVCLSSLGNTQLRPERSRELEGGIDMQLWENRLILTVTQYNKTVNDEILSIPTAPSILGGSFNVAANVGEVRNTGTELTVNAAILESRALSWNVGVNLSNDNNVLVHLNQGQSINYNLGLVPGYPLFGDWVRPIKFFADLNRDGIIEQNEIRLGDSLTYMGQANPKYQLNLTTDVHLLNGRLGIYATFAYQNGMTQENLGALNSGAFYLLGNAPSTPLSYEAAVQAVRYYSDPYGFIQTVNEFRFNDLSINYQLPGTLSSWFRVPHASVALQGSNLGLHTNYRGKDPSVNAFSTVSAGDETADLGQVPNPRTWWLKFTLGN